MPAEERYGYGLRYYAEIASVHGIYELANSPFRLIRVLWAITLLTAVIYCGLEIVDAVKGYHEDPVLNQVQTSKMELIPDIGICSATNTMKDIKNALWKHSGVGDCSEPDLVPDYYTLDEFYKDVNIAHHAALGRRPDKFLEVFDKMIGEENFCRKSRALNVSKNHTVDLDVYYKIYFKGFNASTCLKKAYETLTAHKYEGHILSLSWYNTVIREGIVYQSPEVYYAEPTNVSEGFIDDKGAGFCKTYTWKNQTIDQYGEFRFSPQQYAPYYGIFVDDNPVIYTYLPLGVPKAKSHTVSIQVTKFERIKNCTKTIKNRIHETRLCLSKELWHSVGCCLCGHTGRHCPADARCCFSPHICEAFRNITFGDAWSQCFNMQPQCDETVYSATVTSSDHEKPYPEVIIEIKNSQAILTVIEIPRYTPEVFLGTIGGLLGLFVGGSILSIVELLLFAVGFCVSTVYRKMTKAVIGQEPGIKD